MRKHCAILIALAVITGVPAAFSQDVRNTYIAVTAQVADGILTNAKLANMANSTVKCRTTAGTGVPEDCTGANIVAIAGVTTNGTAAVGQLPGTTTNDAAASGKVGEILTASATAVSLTSGAAKTVVGQALTVGDWDVQCTFEYDPAATTTVGLVIGELTTTTDTTPGVLGSYFRTNYLATVLPNATAGAVSIAFATPLVPVPLAGTTTYNCNVAVIFAISTMTANAKLTARRTR